MLRFQCTTVYCGTRRRAGCRRFRCYESGSQNRNRESENQIDCNSIPLLVRIEAIKTAPEHSSLFIIHWTKMAPPPVFMEIKMSQMCGAFIFHPDLFRFRFNRFFGLFSCGVGQSRMEQSSSKLSNIHYFRNLKVTLFPKGFWKMMVEMRKRVELRNWYESIWI